MPNLPRYQSSELEAVEFPAVVELVAGGARTLQGREEVGNMHPWDGRAGLRRLRQRELAAAWEQSPSALPIEGFDEALDELLSPAGWLLPEHWRQLRIGLGATAVLLRTIAALTWPEDQPAEPGTHLGIDPLQITARLLPDPGPIAEQLSRS
ncbi:MAG TPA: hypothetical protein VN436_07245, partial [Holophaga sp.]|nr:hypothetical protein [Holophaga sp.]